VCYCIFFSLRFFRFYGFAVASSVLVSGYHIIHYSVAGSGMRNKIRLPQQFPHLKWDSNPLPPGWYINRLVHAPRPCLRSTVPQETIRYFRLYSHFPPPMFQKPYDSFMFQSAPTELALVHSLKHTGKGYVVAFIVHRYPHCQKFLKL
jgi:hypothetical protein